MPEVGQAGLMEIRALGPGDLETGQVVFAWTF
jgi:hypothetical protein